jgi:ABC-2 type transport system permease protein
VKVSLATQIWSLSQRSVVKTLKQPAVIVPTLVFPLFFLAINASGLDASTKIKGFPTDSYLTFALATTFVQAGISGVSVAGGALAEDIETGFMSRLSLTPMQGVAVLFGHLAGTAAVALIGAIIYLAIGLAFGASVKAGVGGALVLLPLSVLIALAFGSIGVLAALRTGSAEAVQAVFPVLFVMLFLSSMAMPRNLIEIDWFRTIATYNPLSYLIEAVRSLLIEGWDAEALALGIGIASVITVVAMVASVSALKLRLLRT